MPANKPIDIDGETVQTLTMRLLDAQVQVYDTQELQRVYRHDIVKAMTEASFGDVFPSPYIEDINAFIKQALADGATHVVISLLTAERGLGSFLYEIHVSSKGVSLSQALMWHVPKKPEDRTLPSSFIDYPHLALDVSLSG